MRKLIYSLIAVLVLASTTVFAQDSEELVEFGLGQTTTGQTDRTLTIYLDATSGTLVPTASTIGYDVDNNTISGAPGAGYFDGSEFEVGAVYSFLCQILA